MELHLTSTVRTSIKITRHNADVDRDGDAESSRVITRTVNS